MRPLTISGLEALGVGALFARQAQDDGQFVLFARGVDGAGGHAGEGQAQGADDVGGGDAVQPGLFAVHAEEELLLVGLGGDVGLDDALLQGEAVAEDRGGGDQVGVGLVGAAVDFGDDGGHDGRAGRHFDDAHQRAGFAADGFDVVADAQGDARGCSCRALAREQVDAHVGQVRGLAQVVFAHEPVEVHRRAVADGGDEVDDFGDGLEVGFDFAHGGVGGLQRGALGHVHDDLQLVLVVERQHLERHAPGGGQEDGEPEQARHDQHQEVAAPREATNGAMIRR
jgi:hypothetical protein